MRGTTAILVLAAGAFAAEEPRVPRWSKFETSLKSSSQFAHPLQEVEVKAVFTAPSGSRQTIYGFWDGGDVWKVRFAPDEQGRWTFMTTASDTANRGLHGVRGAFVCTSPKGTTRFERHGPVRVSSDRKYFEHADGTPFFFLGDTAWNGPLHSSADDWRLYLAHRAGQRYTAIQWVATHWRGATKGDAEGRPAFTGREKIAIDPAFFKRLDTKVEAVQAAGLLNAIVMLWAFDRPPNDVINPGFSLPEDQAILLARYMLARWGADHVIWLLNGDGRYEGEVAQRWIRIGRGVFTGVKHAPVSLHPGGRHWPIAPFRNEPWLAINGYQSAHSDSESNSRWITSGEPARAWKDEPPRVVISLEAPYELNAPGSADIVRRNHYWSVLNAVPAGIAYGASGIWSWSNGVDPIEGHGQGRVVPHWKEAMRLPAGAQMAHLFDFFNSVPFARLRPAPEVLAEQPGVERAELFVSAAQSESRDITVLYLPSGATAVVDRARLPRRTSAEWFNPRNRARTRAEFHGDGPLRCTPPAAGDWLIVFKESK
jgi:hypothetical protein